MARLLSLIMFRLTSVSVCGDALLESDTVRRIERLLDEKRKPAMTVPLYEFA